MPHNMSKGPVVGGTVSVCLEQWLRGRQYRTGSPRLGADYIGHFGLLSRVLL
jgi:hypothetical protein